MVAFERTGNAALAPRLAVLERGQHTIPDRTVELTLGPVEFLGLEAFDHTNHVREALRTLEITPQPVERVCHAAGHPGLRGMDLDRAIDDQSTRAGLMVGGQQPGVLAAATQLRCREIAFPGRNPGQGPRKHLIVAIRSTQGENNVILSTVIESALAVEAHRDRPGIARLGHVVLRLVAKETLQLGHIRLAAPRMVNVGLPVKRTDIVVRERPDHMVALVEVTQPPSAQSRQDFVFPEIKTDDPAGKRQEGAVVGQLAAHRIGHRNRALTHTLGQTGHAEQRIAAEGHRIEPRIGHPRVEHIDALQAGNTL